MKAVKLYVSNMPRGMTEEDLLRVFAGAGKVVAVELLHDARGETHGEAIVEMASERDASAAISYLDGYEFDSHALSVVHFDDALRFAKDSAVFHTHSARKSLHPLEQIEEQL